MRTTKFWAALSVVALGSTLSACALDGAGGSGNAAPSVDPSAKVTGNVSLQTWALKPKFTDYVQGVIDAFEKQYPGTKVTWLDQPGDGYSEKVLSQASAGELPDVTNLPPDFALPLAKEGQLLDLTTVDKDLDSTYVAGGLGAYKYNGLDGTYGYPWYLTTDLNYWNTDMFTAAGLDATKPPTSLDELIAQAKTMKAATGEYLMSRKPGIGDFAAEGIDVLNADGTKFVFNTPQAVALLDKYRQAYADGLMPQDVLTDAYLGNSQLFTKGQVAWTTGGGNSIGGFETDNPSLKGKVLPSPYIGTTPLYVQGVSVSSKSKNIPAAIALARFLTNAENQAAFAKIVPGIFPSTTASADDPTFSKSDGTPAGDAKVIAFDNLKDAKVLQPVQVTEAMATIVNQQMAAAISGQTTSQQALDTAVEQLNQLLGQ